MAWPPVSDGDVRASIALRRSPKPGAFTAAHVEGAAELVHDERREGLALHVLGDDQQGALLGDLLEQRAAGPSCSRSSSRA